MNTIKIGDSVSWNSNIGTHNGVIKDFVHYGDREFIQLQSGSLIHEIENTKEMLDKVNFQLIDKKIKIGQRYIYNNNMDYEFILAQVESSRVCLIVIQTGNRWNDPIKVDDVNNISKYEFEHIACPAHPSELTLI